MPELNNPDLPSFTDSKYDELLLSRVRPAGWKNPDAASCYNLVVLGAGSAGLVAAALTAELGGRVAIVERGLLGGDCLNSGCVPSKSFIASSRYYAALQNPHRWGASIPSGFSRTDAKKDFPAVMQRMRRIRARLAWDDSVERYKRLGVDVFLGEGRFLGPNSIEVAGQKLKFKRALIATGAEARLPEIDGLGDIDYHTNQTIFNLTEAPESLLVLGGGPLGCELAQAFSRLGSDVKIVQEEKAFLQKEERDAADLISRALGEDGVSVHLSSTVTSFRRDSEGIIATIQRDGAEFTERAEQVLLGTGRIPTVQGLDLEKAGVEFDETRGVIVNEYLQSSNSKIYAAGDVCSEAKFTHMAEATGQLFVRNAFFPSGKKQSTLVIPWCTYTDPEIAHVGLYVREARRKGISVRTYTIPLNDVDRAITEDEECGFVKIHVSEKGDTILGATIVASHAGDMISEISLAMNEGIGLSKLSKVIHPYPTQSSAIKLAGDAWQKSRFTPLRRRWSERYFSWLRRG